MKLIDQKERKKLFLLTYDLLLQAIIIFDSLRLFFFFFLTLLSSDGRILRDLSGGRSILVHFAVGVLLSVLIERLPRCLFTLFTLLFVFCFFFFFFSILLPIF